MQVLNIRGGSSNSCGAPAVDDGNETVRWTILVVCGAARVVWCARVISTAVPSRTVRHPGGERLDSSRSWQQSSSGPFTRATERESSDGASDPQLETRSAQDG